jgi:tetratricopeptide (TPR) repeat protein
MEHPPSWDLKMAKLGRNDPCHCGSGKKYKQCCLKSDEAAELAAAPPTTPKTPKIRPDMIQILERLAEPDELTQASNAVPDLLDAGKIDEAEKAAHDLLERFPEVHDGYDRLGMVCEAKGEFRQAADYYRKAAEFIRENPDLYDVDYDEVFEELAEEADMLADQQLAPIDDANPESPTNPS